MAKQAAEFIAKTVTDPELAEAFLARVGDRPFEEAADDVVAFAHERGYALDRAALLAARAEIAEAAGGDEPLSDEALATVSGGVLGAAMGGVIAGVGAITPGGTKQLPSAGTLAKGGMFNPISKNFWWPFG